MTLPTIISRVYAVSSAAGCTVSTVSGITLLSIPANSQGFFAKIPAIHQMNTVQIIF